MPGGGAKPYLEPQLDGSPANADQGPGMFLQGCVRGVVQGGAWRPGKPGTACIACLGFNSPRSWPTSRDEMSDEIPPKVK